MIVDGHDLPAILGAFEEAARTKHKPTVLLAKTFKGKGISFMQDQPNWHGKPVPQGAEMQKAIDELSQHFNPMARRLLSRDRPPSAAAPTITPLPPLLIRSVTLSRHVKRLASRLRRWGPSIRWLLR